MRDMIANNLVIRLLGETSRRAISWSVEEVPHPIDRGSNFIVPIFLETSYQGQRIAVYEIKYKRFIDESEFYWASVVNISILDGVGRTLWKYEGDDPELNELLTDARRSLSNVDSFLNQFR